MHHPTDRITHTTAFVTQVVEHKMGREIAYRMEGNVLFNDTLNTFYLRLYDVSQDHSLPSLHGLLFSISSKGSFI